MRTICEQKLSRCLAICIMLWSALISAQAASYYVTQSGAGSGNGTSLGNAWSVSTFNASSTPAAGDTVVFSGTITSTVSPNKGGSSGNPITLNFSAATLNNASPRIQITQNYLNVLGGQLGPGNMFGMFNFNASVVHDILIANWGCTNTDGSTTTFIDGRYAYNLTVSNCWCWGNECFV